MTNQPERRPPLTVRQEQVLGCISTFIDREGWAPTLRELSDILGVAPNAARDHLVMLERKGYIKVGWGRARAIAVVTETEAAAIPTEQI